MNSLVLKNQLKFELMSQFHQRFTRMFFVQIFLRQKLQSWLLGLKFWHQKFCTKNACIKR
jgi:hypothetical protein